MEKVEKWQQREEGHTGRIWARATSWARNLYSRKRLGHKKNEGADRKGRTF